MSGGGRSALAAALAALACAGGPEIPAHLLDDVRAAEPSAPLGGEALVQRRGELERAQRDLAHFHATLESLRDRRDRSGAILFTRFLDAYMGVHLDPLLASEWQSRHPELMALDATLRLMKAAVLIQMREPGRVQRVLDELEERFAGRETMLVAFPFDAQSSLAEALESLRRRKWRG